MAENFYSILTAVGLAKIANAQVSGNKVDLTQIAVGDGGGTYYNPTQNDTHLKNEVWRGNIGSVEIDPENPNWIVIESYIPSTVGGFTVREVGIFDAEGDMIAIGKYPETFKPSLEEGASKDLLLRMIIEVTNASAVTLKIDPGVIIASRKYVDEKVGVVSNNLMQLQQDFMSHSAENVTHLQVAIESFPIIAPEADDSPRIQRAIDYCETNGIGILKAEGNYTLGSTINLPSNLIILGTSPIRTKLYLLENVTAFDVNGKRNIVIKDLAFDGGGRTGTRVFYSHNETTTIQFDNVWIDSVEKGIETMYTYFLNLKNVRVMGTKVPFLFRNATNVVNMENCSSVVPAEDDKVTYSGYAITAFNGSCLNVKGCSFEGQGGKIAVYTWSGLSLDAVYFENQSGIQGSSWILLGNALGGRVKGASIKGCNFLGGFNYAISIRAVEGVEISGNTFDVDLGGILYYQHDNSPKVGVDIGQNSYKTGISPINYSGPTIDNLNSNETSTQLMPLLFKKQKEPQASHLENEDVVVFNRGEGVLGVRRKNSDGKFSEDTLFTGISGATVMFAGTTSKVVTHNLKKTPSMVVVTAEGDIGNIWVTNRGNTEFTINCSSAPSSNVSVFWIAR